MSEVVTMQRRPIDVFRAQLDTQTDQLAAMLPAHVSVEKFKRVVLTGVANAPEILDADRRSLFLACSRAAADGLMLDGREAAPVVFRTKAGPRVQYMPMVAGILKKVRNSGELVTISAHCVHQKDAFAYELGDAENIAHKPYLGDEPGPIIAVYAIAKTRDGGIYREVMTRAQVEKVRAASRAKDGGPWVAWWDEMARKTVIRRLAKRLPMSTDREEDIRRMLESEDEPRDVTTSADVPPPPTRDQFIAQDEAAPPSSPDEDAPTAPDEDAEREADRMQAREAAGESSDGEAEVDPALVAKAQVILASIAAAKDQRALDRIMLAQRSTLMELPDRMRTDIIASSVVRKREFEGD